MEAEEQKEEQGALAKRPSIITILCGIQFIKFIFLLNTVTDSRTQELLGEFNTPPANYTLIRFIIGFGIFVGVSSVWNLKRWGTWVFWIFAGVSLLYGLAIHEPRLYLHIDDFAFGVICWHYYKGLR